MVYLAYTEPEAIKVLTILGVSEKDAVRAVRGLKKGNQHQREVFDLDQ